MQRTCHGAAASILPSALTRWRLASFTALVLLASVLFLPLTAQAAVSALVVEHASGRTISAVNADDPWYPASLTKMMTLYLLFDALDRGRVDMNTRLRVSSYAASRPPSKLGLRPGTTITVRQAMMALATKSANDAAVVVAEGLARSESAFAKQMTSRAQALGMRRTIFRNASGLHHPQQRTTARDMALLGRALLRDHPQHYGIFATRSFQWGHARYENHNRLMSAYRGMDGIKTGYTQPAGYNLVASASRKGRRLVGVVMGSQSSAVRNGLMASLLDQGFRTQPGSLAVASTKAKQTRTNKAIAATHSRRSPAHAAAKLRPAGAAASRQMVQKKARPTKPAQLRARREAAGA